LRVLLVEDDRRLARAIAEGLAVHNVALTQTHDAASARRDALLGGYDVIVLDVMLPDGNGIELCRWIRAVRDETPILMLTARDTVEDRVRGLDAGADDYLVKPFALAELLARVRALARRSPGILPEVIHVADLVADLRSRKVTRAGRDLSLTNKEWDLFEFFVRHHGAVVGRAEITAYVWDENHDPFSNALEVLVRRLRAKLDDGFGRKLIHTVRGAGYRFGIEDSSRPEGP
jgi:two-component system, OmpR family, copper resistance phosphate regulon response regulator CusR